MAEPQKQHLIDPEFCIRCYTCEESCPIGAITHNDDNVVVDASICNHCMDCISPCPTGSIDSWRVVAEPYSLEEQLGWMELPEQQEFANDGDQTNSGVEAFDEEIAALLAEAHKGSGQVPAPSSASKPSINLHNLANPVEGKIQGNFRLTAANSDSDVRHIIINLADSTFPVLEGQSVGVICPGVDVNGKPHLPRLYSISSPRDGERPNVNNISLTVKREEFGVCSNYVCDLEKADTIKLTGPFGASFLMPDDPQAKLLMICTGTGSAPFRGFTMRRQRVLPEQNGALKLFFGARTPDSLPYFGPLNKIPNKFLDTHFAFSRVEGKPKNYVQDELRRASVLVGQAMDDPQTYIYICGMKAMEEGVENALNEIASNANLDWNALKDEMRKSGRYHVETY